MHAERRRFCQHDTLPAQASAERVSSAAVQYAARPDVVMLGADNAGHVAQLRPLTARAEAAGVRAPTLLGKHSRGKDSADVIGQATTAAPVESGLAGTADVPAPDSDGESDAPLQTIGDQVAALPQSGDEMLRTSDAHPAAKHDVEEPITADSLTVLLSQVRHILCKRNVCISSRHECCTYTASHAHEQSRWWLNDASEDILSALSDT